MFASLDRIDIVATATDGHVQYWQSDHRTPEEIEKQRALSTLFAITRILNPRRGTDTPVPAPMVIYSSMYPPPEFLRQAIRAAGGRLSIGDGLELEPEPDAAPPQQGEGGFLGRALRGLFGGSGSASVSAAAPSVDDIIQAAFATLAREVAAEHGVGLDIEGLQAVESALAARNPDREDDETAYWTAVFKLGVFGGELIRASNGGRWAQVDSGTLPFALSTRYRGGQATVNPLGKAIKLFGEGEADSLVALVQVIRANP